jgi:hypothetical protein
VVAHALLFRTCGLELGRLVCGCRAVGRGSMGVRQFSFTLVLVSVLVVPGFVPAFIRRLGVVAVLRGGAPRCCRRLVSCLVPWRLFCLRARGGGAGMRASARRSLLVFRAPAAAPMPAI